MTIMKQDQKGKVAVPILLWVMGVPFTLVLLIFGTAFSQSAAELKKSRVTLPNGWSLSPAGRSLNLGDLPLNMVISSSGKWMAVTNNGQSTQELQLIDLKSERTVNKVIIPKSWLGLKFSRDENFLYVSGGNDNWILKYAVLNKRLVLKDSIKLGKKWPVKISPAGLDIDDQKQLLYVVTKEDNSLYIVDLRLRVVVKKIQLDAEAYTCVLSPDKTELYISCWGCDKVTIFNTVKQMIVGSIGVGDPGAAGRGQPATDAQRSSGLGHRSRRGRLALSFPLVCRISARMPMNTAVIQEKYWTVIRPVLR